MDEFTREQAEAICGPSRYLGDDVTPGGDPISEPYVPVDTTYEARQEWPHHAFVEDQLNGRELGQFIAGFVWGESMKGDRAWHVDIPESKLAAVSAALVARGFAVAKDWNPMSTNMVELAIWSGL